jgi:hypothetical protein
MKIEGVPCIFALPPCSTSWAIFAWVPSETRQLSKEGPSNLTFAAKSTTTERESLFWFSKT